MERHGQATQLPYPPIRITKQNKSYAQAILDNMGGRVSEMSAVSLYFYNHLITEKFPEVAEHVPWVGIQGYGAVNPMEGIIGPHPTIPIV